MVLCLKDIPLPARVGDGVAATGEAVGEVVTGDEVGVEVGAADGAAVPR